MPQMRHISCWSTWTRLISDVQPNRLSLKIVLYESLLKASKLSLVCTIDTWFGLELRFGLELVVLYVSIIAYFMISNNDAFRFLARCRAFCITMLLCYYIDDGTYSLYFAANAYSILPILVASHINNYILCSICTFYVHL